MPHLNVILINACGALIILQTPNLAIQYKSGRIHELFKNC